MAVQFLVYTPDNKLHIYKNLSNIPKDLERTMIVGTIDRCVDALLDRAQEVGREIITGD